MTDVLNNDLETEPEASLGWRDSWRRFLSWARTPDGVTQERVRPAAWAAILLVPIAWTVLRWGWVSDDSLITARVVLNFLHGNGPVYNVGEHVQAFTHPLWFFTWSALSGITGEVILMPVFMGVVCSAGAAYCVWRGASSATAAFIALFGLLVSTTFVTWSTAGLEAPLAMLLIGILWCTYRQGDQRRLLIAAFLVALVGLTRLDLLVLVAPVAAVMVLQARRNTERFWFLGAALVPIFAYMIWSRAYYGYALPATFYAKTNVEIPRFDLIFQGWRYVTFWVRFEPESAVLFAVGLALLVRARSAYAAAWALGVAGYILYVVWIGGDFMEGRFIVVPLYVCALGIARYFPSLPNLRLHPAVLIFGCCFALWLLAGTQNPAIASDNSGERWFISNDVTVNAGIADERGVWVTKGFGLSDWFYDQNQREPNPVLSLTSHDATLGDPSIEVAVEERAALASRVDRPGSPKRARAVCAARLYRRPGRPRCTRDRFVRPRRHVHGADSVRAAGRRDLAHRPLLTRRSRRLRGVREHGRQPGCRSRPPPQARSRLVAHSPLARSPGRGATSRSASEAR